MLHLSLTRKTHVASWLLAGMLLIGITMLGGCATGSHKPYPAVPEPNDAGVIPLLVGEARPYLITEMKRIIPEKRKYGALLAFRSPRAGEAPPSPYDKDIRQQLANALASDRELSERCDVTSVMPDEAEQLDEASNWKQKVAITGELSPEANSKTYLGDSVYVGQASYSEHSSRNGKTFELDVARLVAPAPNVVSHSQLPHRFLSRRWRGVVSRH